MMAANEIRSYAGISLYVHVPFCQTKCPYCDFNTYQGIEALMTPYLDALASEIRLWGETLGRPTVDTIFFGGGTPSYMPPEQVARLLESVSKAFALSPDAEVTLEANPGDVTGPALESWRQAGVNRLSIGVQSLDDSLLTLLGRRHTAAQAQAAYGLAVASGLENVNLDLMYGLPSQTLERWRDTLEGVLELSPLHLSLYALTLEEGTPLARWVEEGKVPDPDPDLAADMYGLARELLGRSGYDHYEISNWSVAGRRCRHNMAYWLNGQYLGVGPGAHSSLQGHRFWDVASPRTYMERVRQWDASGVVPSQRLDEDTLHRIGPVDGVEAIEPSLEMAETMFLGLRLLDGLSTESFKTRFGQDPLVLYGSQVRELTGLGLLESYDGVLRLSDRGCLLANQVFMRFL